MSIKPIEISSEPTISSQEQAIEKEDNYVGNIKKRSKQNINLVKYNEEAQLTGIISLSVIGFKRPFTSIDFYKADTIDSLFNDFHFRVDQCKKSLELFLESQSDDGFSNSIKTDGTQQHSFNRNSSGSQFIDSDTDRKFSNDDKEFKHPPENAQVPKSKDRISSSTSSTSVRQSSSTGYRCSSASVISSSSDGMKMEEKEENTILVPNSPEQELVEEMNKTLYMGTIPESDTEDDRYIKVFAKFKEDKYYYSGCVKDLDNCVVEVYFDEIEIMKVSKDDIFQYEELPSGTEVEVSLNDNNEFTKGFIIDQTIDMPSLSSKPIKGFQVYNDEGYYEVKRSQIRVREDIIKIIRARTQETSISDISLTNIVEGKRRQKPKRFSSYMLTPVKKRSGSPSIYSLQSQKRKKGKIEQSKLLVSSTSYVKSKLLCNKYFLLTVTTDKEEDERIRSEIEEKISAHSGTVIETVRYDKLKEHRKGLIQIILIVIGQTTDQRTVKYLTALAIGNVPIVSPEWLHDSISLDFLEKFDSYLYPRGIHPITKESIGLQLKSTSKGLFDSWKIWILQYEQTEFAESWEYILDMAGADVQFLYLTDFSPNIDCSNCDIVLAETDGITKRCLEKLNLLGIDIVSSDFFVYSLIINEIQSVQQFLIKDL